MKRKDVSTWVLGGLLAASAAYLWHGVLRVAQMGIMDDDDEDEEVETIVRQVPVQELYRRLLYDTAQTDPEKVLASIITDYVPASSDSLDMERQASNERLTAIQGLIPLLDLQARGISAAAVSLSSGINPALDDDDKARLLEQYHSVAFSALVSSYSSLNDWGVVHLGGVY